MDLSFLQQMENAGVVFHADGQTVDPMLQMKSNGVNCIRLRLWHTPPDQWCNLSNTITVAQRVRDAGMSLLLDMHYSDSWADPGQQTKPSAWSGLSFTELKDEVRNYSGMVISNLSANGVLPDAVQVGNEITAGFLWNEGRIGGGFATNWSRFAELMQAAVEGITNSVPPPEHVDILLHIDRGGDNNGARWFFDQIAGYGVFYDIIGLSYYPWWHGSLFDLSANIADLASRYGKDILLLETAYPWTLGWSDDQFNLVGDPSQLLPGFPATPEGQRTFLCAVRNIIALAGGIHGRGFCYWAPDYVAAPSVGSPWENLALFDFQTNLLLGIQACSEGEDCSNRLTLTAGNDGTLTAQIENLWPGSTARLARAVSVTDATWLTITNAVTTNWAPFSIAPVKTSGTTGVFRVESFTP